MVTTEAEGAFNEEIALTQPRPVYVAFSLFPGSSLTPGSEEEIELTVTAGTGHGLAERTYSVDSEFLIGDSWKHPSVFFLTEPLTGKDVTPPKATSLLNPELQIQVHDGRPSTQAKPAQVKLDRDSQSDSSDWGLNEVPAPPPATVGLIFLVVALRHRRDKRGR